MLEKLREKKKQKKIKKINLNLINYFYISFQFCLLILTFFIRRLNNFEKYKKNYKFNYI